MRKLILELAVLGLCLVSISVYAEPVLHLQFDGPDGSTTFIDSSPSNHTVTGHGDAQIDTSEKKYGTGSLLLDGEGDYLELADSVDWDIAGSNSDDWTIDFWFKFHTNIPQEEVFIAQYDDSSSFWKIWHESGQRMIFIAGGYQINMQAASPSVSDYEWHHVALIKVGSDWAIYLDGSQVDYQSVSWAGTSAGVLRIGVDSVYHWAKCRMDEIRIHHSNYFTASPNSNMTDTIVITIPTDPPVADAGLDAYAMAGETVMLDGSGSYDPDGTIVLYEWSVFSDPDNPVIGEGETFEMIAHGYAEEIIQLRVTDNDGATTTDTMMIINPGIEGAQGPQGEQGPPGMTPEEVAAIQAEITFLKKQSADNRYLLEQLPQLQKKIAELESQVQ